MADDNLYSLDSAIGHCITFTAKHHARSQWVLILLMSLVVILVMCITSFTREEKLFKDYNNQYANSIKRDSISYSVSGNNEVIVEHLKGQISSLQLELLKLEVANDRKGMMEELQKFTNETFNIKDSLSQSGYASTKVKLDIKSDLSRLESQASTGENTIYYYLLFVLLLTIIGLLIFVYKYHLKQMSKYEHYHFAFARLKISKDESNLASPVIDELVKNAFIDDKITVQKFESPLPEVLSSEAITQLANKIAEAFRNTR